MSGTTQQSIIGTESLRFYQNLLGNCKVVTSYHKEKIAMGSRRPAQSIHHADSTATMALEWVGQQIILARNEDNLEAYLYYGKMADLLTDPSTRLVVGDLLSHVAVMVADWKLRIQRKDGIHSIDTHRMPSIN